MEYLTKESFLKQVEELKALNPEHWGTTEWKPGQPKATDRWSYHEKAVKLLEQLQPTSILEAGSMGIELSEESDTIDLDMPDWNWRLSYKPTYNYDLTKMPWEVIKDKQYDVFVALRVFHHMEDEANYLKEMDRIANKTILVLNTASADRYEKVRKANIRMDFADTDSSLLFYRSL